MAEQAIQPSERFSAGFSSFLDMSRWLAAMVVVIGHLQHPLLIAWSDLPPSERHLWVLAWYQLGELRHEAVVVFFVLSGFLVGGIGLNKIRAGRFSLTDYGIDRAVRVLIAFIPALFLGVALDLIGTRWFGWTGLWNHSHALLREVYAPYVFENGLTPEIVGGNLLMLQSFKVPPAGSNMPLWSLSYEFWFYVIFACVAVAMASRKLLTAVVCAGLAAAVFMVLGGRLPLLIVMWAIGALACAYSGEMLRRPVLATIAFAGALVFSRWWYAGHDGWNAAVEYSVAGAFGWLLIAWRHRAGAVFERASRFNGFMADFSYSLYLIHFPVVLLSLAVMASAFGIEDIAKGFMPTDPLAVLLYVAAGAVAVAASFGFAQATERHTGAVRSMLKSGMKRALA
jgi:peptidoglycan/LPS O-acetylase OafA/YrhL